MRKLFMALIIFLSLPALAFADLPKEKFMRAAFRQDVLRKWQGAKGVLQLQEEPGKKQNYLILDRPDEKAKSIKEFTVHGPGGIPPINSERWSNYVSERDRYISQLPLFISGFGYDDDIPGYVISIPVLNINNEWALICADWSCNSTGWIKIPKPLILFDAYKSSDSMRVVNLLFTEKAQPIFSKKTNETVLNTSSTLFQYPDYFPPYWNKFYIKLDFIVSEMIGDEIQFKWWYNQQSEFFVYKGEGLTVIRWIEHDSGD